MLEVATGTDPGPDGPLWDAWAIYGSRGTALSGRIGPYESDPHPEAAMSSPRFPFPRRPSRGAGGAQGSTAAPVPAPASAVPNAPSMPRRAAPVREVVVFLLVAYAITWVL